MKKSHFTALILGTIGILFLGLGMCMSLLPEWDMLREGIIVGCIGSVILLITIFVYRRMENKPPIKLSLKLFLTILLGLIGILGLGIGMCLTMVFNKSILGIFVGIIGITLLLCLIPILKGIED